MTKKNLKILVDNRWKCDMLLIVQGAVVLLCKTFSERAGRDLGQYLPTARSLR